MNTLLILVIIVILTYDKIRSRLGLKTSKNTIILDACGLIDGRITALAEAGLLNDQLILVSQSTLDELQHLADNSDQHRRSRARYGLDILGQLKNIYKLNIVVDNTKKPDRLEVDSFLLDRAAQTGASIYTIDTNMIRVANVKQIKCINIAELSQKLSPTMLPGDILEVKLTDNGSNYGQAIGYGDDGSLVVVENATKFVGKYVQVNIKKLHQTSGGRMYFADLVNNRTNNPQKLNQQPAPSAQQSRQSSNRTTNRTTAHGRNRSRSTQYRKTPNNQ